MRKNLKALFAIGTFALIITVAPLLTHADPIIKHPSNSNNYQEHPAPSLVDNTNTPLSEFITKEKAIELSNIPPDAQLISAILTTWGKFNHEEHNDLLGGVGTEVATNRTVWMVKVNYPNGIDTKGDLFKSAVQTIVYDAATGCLLTASTEGPVIKIHSPKQKGLTK